MECIFSTLKSYSLVCGFFSFKTLDKMMYVLVGDPLCWRQSHVQSVLSLADPIPRKEQLHCDCKVFFCSPLPDMVPHLPLFKKCSSFVRLFVTAHSATTCMETASGSSYIFFTC